jgi:hypothetical protein
MRTFHSTKTGWCLFIDPLSDELIELLKKISDAQIFNPNFSFRLELIDFFLQDRILFYVPGWGREELLEFWGENKIKL